jgi:hypothetical protein
MKVTDKPSFDSAKVPPILVAPWDRVIVPGTSAADCTGWAKRTMTRPFSGNPVAPLAG